MKTIVRLHPLGMIIVTCKKNGRMIMHPFRFLLFLFLISNPVLLFAQNPVKNYEKEWKKVDDLVKKELPKSALTEIKKIYELAKKEKQDAQVVKALVYIT